MRPNIPARWIFLSTLGALSASGAEHHVPEDHSSIQAAIDAARDGDEVIVAAGTYTGADNKNLTLDGKDLLLRSADGAETTVIDCAGTGTGFILDGSSAAESGEIRGFTVTGGANKTGGGMEIQGRCTTVIRDCVITRNKGKTDASGGKGGGIYVSGSDANPRITGCTISENGGWIQWGGGIYVDSASPTVENCLFLANRSSRNGGAIHSKDGEANPTFTNCVVQDNYTTASSGYGDGGGVSATSNGHVTLTNCTIRENYTSNSAKKGGGLFVEENSEAELTNCIIWGNSPREIEGREDEVEITYSDVSGGWAGTGNLDSDPLWAAEDDFHLDWQSPCIDAGTSRGAPADDIDSDRRPQGDGIDMGADEYITCDLQVTLSNYPNELSPLDTLSFYAEASNPCTEARTFDEALMKVGGPATLSKPLYAGNTLSLEPGDSLGSEIHLPVPPATPLGSYDVEIIILRQGDGLGSAAFAVELH